MVEHLVVLLEELRQPLGGLLRERGLGPPLGLAQALPLGALPHAARRPRVLGAVELLGLVEEEVPLADDRVQAQEPLHLLQLRPRLADEALPVQDVDLRPRELLVPAGHVRVVDGAPQRRVVLVDLTPDEKTSHL